MPGRITQSTSWTDKEILKFPTGLHAKKSVVLDANTFAVPATGARFVVPAGTILKRLGDKHLKYDGTGSPAGILARPIDLAIQGTQGSEAAPMFYHECVFATQAIVDFTQFHTQLVSTLNTCKFE